MKTAAAGAIATVFTLFMAAVLMASTDPDKGGVGVLFVVAFVSVWLNARQWAMRWLIDLQQHSIKE